ncbi:MAG: hypothetical protein RL308_1732 [Bacteroidota bacterium]|jgi:hypothetical protein
MNELIDKLSEEFGLKQIQMSKSPFLIRFSYSEEKDDFFLFLFSSIEEILAKIDHKLDLEYYLNVITDKIKNDKTISDFKNRALDQNLSVILVLNCDPKMGDLDWVYKCEENYVLSKKYVLLYDDNTLFELKKRISSNKSGYLESFHSTLINNSNQLTSLKMEPWYSLLTTVYSKIPFLNYVVSEGDQKTLSDVQSEIDKELIEKDLDGLYEATKQFDKGFDMMEFLEQNKLI